VDVLDGVGFEPEFVDGADEQVELVGPPPGEPAEERVLEDVVLEAELLVQPRREIPRLLDGHGGRPDARVEVVVEVREVRVGQRQDRHLVVVLQGFEDVHGDRLATSFGRQIHVNNCNFPHRIGHP
jgi:hypothetical protein